MRFYLYDQKYLLLNTNEISDVALKTISKWVALLHKTLWTSRGTPFECLKFGQVFTTKSVHHQRQRISPRGFRVGVSSWLASISILEKQNSKSKVQKNPHRENRDKY